MRGNCSPLAGCVAPVRVRAHQERSAFDIGVQVFPQMLWACEQGRERKELRCEMKR